MFLAGVPVRDELVLELARLVDDDELAGRLEDAYGGEVKGLVAELERLEDQRKLARILIEVGEEAPDAATSSPARTQHHDRARMRGIPIVG